MIVERAVIWRNVIRTRSQSAKRHVFARRRAIRLQAVDVAARVAVTERHAAEEHQVRRQADDVCDHLVPQRSGFLRTFA